MIFTLRIQDKVNTVTYTALDYFSFQSDSSLLNKYKKPIKNKIKTLLQENPLLNETDLYETDDPVTKRIPQQNSKISHELLTTFTCLKTFCLFLQIPPSVSINPITLML